MMADDGLDGQVFAKIAERLEEPELTELKKTYEARVAGRFPAEPQLRRKDTVQKTGDETVFLV